MFVPVCFFFVCFCLLSVRMLFCIMQYVVQYGIRGALFSEFGNCIVDEWSGCVLYPLNYIFSLCLWFRIIMPLMAF